jgi:threonylcarbamoyladenosine tRNA methylthiotransferase MtaB
MNIVIKTLGCKANRYESDKIQSYFEDKHLVVDAAVATLKHADIVIINTCTVTHAADRKSRQAIPPLKKLYPDAKIIVFGCGVNVDTKGYSDLPIVDFAVKETNDLIKLIEKISKTVKSKPDHSHLPKNRTRALIKIQDGCNNFCAYCIVPFARGREKSRPFYEIIEEINDKVEKGYKEAVLTGINIGAYKNNNLDLADLIELILRDTKIERLRLSSIEPQNFNHKFLELLKDKRFCQHLHISLQSGCDETLKHMRRRYDTKMYLKMVNNLRKAAPNISITTDIIVGFPGETEGHFIETINFIKKAGFSKIHIFPYSKRNGTAAAKFPNQIPENVKKVRCNYLSKIEKQLRHDFYEKNLNRSEEVLIESIDKKGFAIGFTSNYLKTRIHAKIETNQIIPIKLKELSEDIEIIGAL